MKEREARESDEKVSILCVGKPRTDDDESI